MNNSLCGNLFLSSLIIFDDNLKIAVAEYFFAADFDLLSCEFDNLR